LQLNQIMTKHIASSIGKLVRLSPGKITVCASILLLACALVFLPAVYLDGFLKGRITRALVEAYPAYTIQIARMHYNILENRLDCDSVVLMKIDSTFSCSVHRFSVSGIGRIQLLWGGGVAPDNLVSSRVSAEDIVLTFPESQYELRCRRLRVSVRDSEFVADALELHPSEDDEQFFAESKFTRTRFRLVIPQCRVTGLACLGLLDGKNYRARAAQIYDASLSVLVNKDKPGDATAPSPVMPNVFLAPAKESMQIDSIRIMNGRLMYNERSGVGSKPAVLTFDSVQVMAEGVGNTGDRGDTAVIRAQGILMNTGVISVRMSIPVASPEFSFRYSGSLSEMNLSEFNPFVEISEHKRLKTGIIHTAAFDIDVTAGRASGMVRAVYKDLKIVAIQDSTGSEKGVGNQFVSFLANNVKLRTTNMPDKSGYIKIGEVKYERKSGETFLEFAWFALRSGISNVIGF
jgi:hypothetical protein